ncbi:YdeI/OmpD-associated family protein [Maribacter sp. 2210JD10-5]|uniref:YdeI/OmpD-associated family protein n=1 Tax=Maribacter sp. 2210JD10-5 TaxID=3386272 RepID=UPI0039BC4ECA
MEKSEKVEAYYAEEHPYSKAIGKLRDLALKTGLEETFKWMFPTYTHNNKNVLAICKFKQHFGIWFFNGVFLSDPKNVLQNAQEGKTQAMLHWKFTTIDEIDDMPVLAYMNEALENEKKGLRLLPKKKKKTDKIQVPLLLQESFQKDSKLEKAFAQLSLSKQNEYVEYITTAKQEKTKLSRLGKILPMILKGKGLNDKYRK